MGNEVKIGFFGDFTTGENYQLKIDTNCRKSILRRFGYNYLFEKVDSILKSSDFNIFNLETPLTNKVTSTLLGVKTVCHWADPEIVPSYLKKYNVEAVTLGNNHALDYDREGLEDTFRALRENNIAYFGAGLNQEEAKQPFKKQITVGDKTKNLYVIGGFKYKQDFDTQYNFYAKDNKEGVYLLTDKIGTDIISSIKREDSNAFVVVFPHFGFDLLKTTKHQIDYAHSFIDAGADCVIGHGPHMLNSIEKYKEKIILYGIGNFIFPANFYNKVLPYNLTAQLTFFESNNEISSKISLYPIYMDTNSFEPQTRPINQDELDRVLGLILENSNISADTLKITTDELIKIEI